MLRLNPDFAEALRRLQRERAELEAAKARGQEIGRWMRKQNAVYRAAGAEPPYPEIDQPEVDRLRTRAAELESRVAELMALPPPKEKEDAKDGTKDE